MHYSLFSAYISAEITLFWVHDGETNRLIFAVTELIPLNQTPSEPLGGGKIPYLSKSICSMPKVQIRCHRYYCAVDQAVACMESSDWASLPDAPQNLQIGKDMKREPAIGFSVTLSRGHTPFHVDKIGLSMVLPNRSTSFRTYALLDNDHGVGALYSEAEHGKIIKFIKRYCRADLQTYGEFFGASIFCMQNPIFWDYKSFGIDDDKQLSMLLLPRDGQTVDGMRYMISCEHPFGLSNASISEIRSEVITFPMPSGKIYPSLFIWDKQGNLLEAKPLSLFGSISGMSSSRRELPNGETTAIWPLEHYKSQIREKSLLDIYEEKRLYALLERKGEFYYFKAGENEKAISVIGKMLIYSGISITVCDMYLEAKGFDDFIRGWVKCETLTLFASKNWLNGHAGSLRYMALVASINTMINNKEIKTVTLYGISGGNHDYGFVHDRFIITDKDVYCIGASLNGFGSRDTVLFKSPNPAAFKNRVSEWKAGNAHLLGEWK